MADEATPITETPKKTPKGPAKARKAKPVAAHPKVSVMVTAAIKDLGERGGSSLQAIKKYVGSHYKVDVERLAPFIKKYLKTAVASGELVQKKGKGASGSFKLKAAVGKAEGKPKAAKKPAARKAKPAAAPARKAAKPAVKKASVKKVTKKPKAEKKSKPVKSPRKSKAKAAAKPKPKPRPKKAAAPKKAAPKKAKK